MKKERLIFLLVSMCVLLKTISADGIFDGNFMDRLRQRLNLPTRNPPPAPPTTVAPILTTGDAVIRQRLGPNVRQSKYDHQVYVASNGGPVTSGDDLECNFQGYCCWDNAGFPTDQFDWSLATGQPDHTCMMQNFGVSQAPTGRYLIAARPNIRLTDEAMFMSCTISCTTHPIKVKFRHWTTQGVQLQVCSSETFFNDNNKVQLINCQDVKRSESPGPSVITLPPDEFLDIIFVASNFQGPQGGIAIIDDITVDFTPCSGRKPKQSRHGT